VLGSARSAAGMELAEALRDGGRDELVHVAAARCDLLDATRRDEGDAGARHDVNGLDVGGERSVELVHLELPLEVGDHSQALHDRLSAPLLREVDHEYAEDVHLHVVDAFYRLM